MADLFRSGEAEELHRGDPDQSRCADVVSESGIIANSPWQGQQHNVDDGNDDADHDLDVPVANVE